MRSFFSLAGCRPGLAWVWGLLLGVALLQPGVARATHLRAGDIQARVDSVTGNPNHIYFKLHVYRDNGPNTASLAGPTIFFGDNTRLDNIGIGNNGAPVAPGTSFTKVLDAASNTEIYTFSFDHTYAGPNSYTISYTEVNRNDAIINMTASISQSFLHLDYHYY